MRSPVFIYDKDVVGMPVYRQYSRTRAPGSGPAMHALVIVRSNRRYMGSFHMRCGFSRNPDSGYICGAVHGPHGVLPCLPDHLHAAGPWMPQPSLGDFHAEMEARIDFGVSYGVKKGLLKYGNSYVTLRKGTSVSAFADCVALWTVVTKETEKNLFANSESYFELINNISNPHNVLEVIFPLLSIVDSVFAAQLLLCMAFGNWLNAVMKWWLLEDRPYWWIRETDFYTDSRRPTIRQFRQTCETGPGCPSGHSATTAMVLILAVFWISHVVNDRKCSVCWWWRLLVYPLFAAVMGSVMLARIFVGAHFPHQTILGAIVGAFLAPALCIYVSDPYIWRYGYHKDSDVRTTMLWHVISAGTTIAISLLTYLTLHVCGWDPLWTIKLAFRWCETPEDIHVTSTPMFALVHSTGHLLGWALCVTPAIAAYRHDTKNRSLIVSAFTTCIIIYIWKTLQQNISKESAWRFYAMQFLVCVVKPPLLLRFTPAVAMWPYGTQVKLKKKTK